MFEMPKGFKLPKPSNDNLTEATQVRMKNLDGSKDIIEEVKEWVQRKREELSAPGSSEVKNVRAQEIESVLNTVESALAEADAAVSLAQTDLGSSSTFGLAAAAAYRLEVSLIEAQSVLGE